MKRQSCILHKMMLGVVVLLVVGMGHAQIGGDVIKVKLPFNFSIGTQRFPAGEYSLKPLLPNTMLLRNQAGQTLTSIATNSVESTEALGSTKLDFNNLAGQHFLAPARPAREGSPPETDKKHL